MISHDPIIPPDTDFSPAAHRNSAPIFDRLFPWIEQMMEKSGQEQLTLLELASGTGQHAAYFASRHPALLIQPSDQTTERAKSVQTWVLSHGVSDQVAMMKAIDVTQPSMWPKLRFDILYCANMIHISPWATTEALFRESSSHLQRHGLLITYGPYRFDTPLAPSNASFDESLKQRNPRWGIRSIDQLDRLAAQVGLKRIETISCPANNHLLIFALDTSP